VADVTGVVVPADLLTPYYTNIRSIRQAPSPSPELCQGEGSEGPG
jgi:hypothetical protein